MPNKRPPGSPDERLGRETLHKLRDAVRAIDAGSRRGIVDLAAAASDARVTVDFDAREDLGHPLVVLEPAPPRPSWWPSLSPREQEVAALLADGLSNDEIGRALFISVATVKDHVHHVLQKAGASRRSQVAAALAHSGGTGERA